MNWAFFLKSWQSNLADRIGSSSNWSWENVSSYCSWTKGMVKQTVTTNERLKRLWIYESHILELRIKTWIWAIFVVMNTTWASTATVSQRSWAQIKSRTRLNFIQALFSLLPKQCSLLRRSLSYSQWEAHNLLFTFVRQPYVTIRLCNF